MSPYSVSDTDATPHGSVAVGVGVRSQSGLGQSALGQSALGQGAITTQDDESTSEILGLDDLLRDYVDDDLPAESFAMDKPRKQQPSDRWSFEQAASRHGRIGTTSSVAWFVTTSRKDK